MNVDTQQKVPERSLDHLVPALNHKDPLSGNSLSFNPKTGVITLSTKSGDRNLGKIGYIGLNDLIWSKTESEKDVYRKFGAWSINSTVLHTVDIIEFTTELATYRINSKDAKAHTLFRSTDQGVERKHIVPISFWHVKFHNSLDQIASRLVGPSWARVLKDEFRDPYMDEIAKKINGIRKTENVYPDKGQIFSAYKATPYDQVKVVIIGQDPYHGHGQANGLAFSSLAKQIPPSLKNIFKEVEEDVGNGLMLDPSPDLTRWAEQGVFLLNRILTVSEGKPLSHINLGWERFTLQTIRELQKRPNIVYMLWGNEAQKIRSEILPDNLVLTAAHPSPYSAANFFGCRHFSKANQYLSSKNLREIKW